MNSNCIFVMSLKMLLIIVKLLKVMSKYMKRLNIFRKMCVFFVIFLIIVSDSGRNTEMFTEYQFFKQGTC